MQISKTSKAFMHITNLAKMCCGPIALSAYICAAICLSPAAAEESQEAAEDGEEIVENATTNEEETEATQIDYKKEAEALVLGASLEDKGDEQGESDEDSEETDGEEETESEETDGEDSAESGDDESVKEDTTTENSSNASIPAGSAGGGGGAGGDASDVSVPVEASETTEELDIPQDENADVIAEAIDIATETSENTGANYKVIAAVNSETKDSTSVTPIQQRFSTTASSTYLSSGSTQQYNTSVALSSGVDSGFSGYSSSGSGYSYAATASTESTPANTGNGYTMVYEDGGKTIRLPKGMEIEAGTSLYVPEKLIIGKEFSEDEDSEDAVVTINEGASISVGIGPEVAGSIIISNAGNSQKAAALKNVSVSVSQDAQGKSQAYITVNDDPYVSHNITNACLDLTQLKQDATVTLEHINLSNSQILQTHGSLHLVNKTSVSFGADSKIKDIYVDYTSSFHGDDVSQNVQLSGVNNRVDFQVNKDVGTEDLPARNSATISSVQLYGLTAQEGTQITLNMDKVYFAPNVSKIGGKFKIELAGLNWAPLDEASKIDSNAAITDSKIINNFLILTDFNSSFDADLVKYLTITSVSYVGSDQGVVVEFTIVPEPTTTTLSLLALSALAARRRRRL